MSTRNQSSIPSLLPEETREKEKTSHDLIWKQTLSLFLADLLELLDPELGAFLDVEEAEFIDKEAFSDFPKGERTEADLVAKARTRENEPRIILCHLEVEGEFREQIDERISRYFVHLKGKYNLPVLSVVVFLTGGTAGVEQREVVETIGPVEVYRFRYLAFG
ncbi:MAG: hypothetical protein GY856_03280, partial [bacterium]|nr:hypothetical protein [bacterium]